MALAITPSQEIRFHRGAETLSVENSSAERDSTRSESPDSEILATTNSHALACSLSVDTPSPSSSYQAELPTTQKTEYMAESLTAPSTAARCYIPPFTLRKHAQCLSCLEPRIGCQPTSRVDREHFLQVRNKNFHARQNEKR